MLEGQKKNILYSLRETQRVSAQILNDGDDDDGLYLSIPCYKLED